MSYRHNDRGDRSGPSRDGDRGPASNQRFEGYRSRDSGPSYSRRSRSPEQRDRRDYRRDRDYAESRTSKRDDERDSRGGGRDDSYRRRHEADNYNPRSRYEPSRYASDRTERIPAPRTQRDDDRNGDRSLNGASTAKKPSASEEKAPATATHKGDDQMQEKDEEEDDDDEQAAMMRAMGFGDFGTTKGTKVKGNQTGLAEVKKERTWRQYMQRKGGFNRPLSPVRK